MNIDIEIMKKRELIINTLQEYFEDLYVNGEYFVSIPKGTKETMGQEYWGIVRDPDGNVRNRSEERQKHNDDIKYIIDYVNSINPGKILDVGCGPGWLLSSISSGWEKHGNEMDKKAINLCKDNSIAFTTKDITNNIYEPNYFDIIILHHVIEHVPDPIKFILAVKKILKSGGKLILGTPDFDSGCARLFRSNYRLLHDPTHISLFSNESMHRLLRDHGFNILKVEYPFFETRYFNIENLSRLFDTKRISPPFYGNFMTFYAICKK